ALGAPHLLQPQDLGIGRLSRLAPQSSSVLSRRVRLSLQPSPHPPCRVPLPARHRRRSRAHHLQDVDLTGSKSIRLLGYISSCLISVGSCYSQRAYNRWHRTTWHCLDPALRVQLKMEELSQQELQIIRSMLEKEYG